MNLRPLGYEHCDARLWYLGRSLVTALASGNPARYLVPEPLSLRCLALSRRVWFTNRFTETVLDVRLRILSTGVSARGLSHRPPTLCQPEKRKADSSILSLTTGFRLVSSALTSVNTGWVLPRLSLSSDHECPCVTVVGRSLSHADRTPCQDALGSCSHPCSAPSAPAVGLWSSPLSPIGLTAAA